MKHLLIYEEVPERTVCLLLTNEDLVKAGLTPEQLASIHGTMMNTTDLTGVQEEIHTKIHERVFGPWNEEKGESDPAIWEGAIIYRTDEDGFPDGVPAKLSEVGDLVVVHTGFVL